MPQSSQDDDSSSNTNSDMADSYPVGTVSINRINMQNNIDEIRQRE